LPAHITPLTDFGQRSEWSLDGKQVYFVDKAGGDVWVVDIRTKKTRQITKPDSEAISDAGVGSGLYLFDIKQFELNNAKLYSFRFSK